MHEKFQLTRTFGLLRIYFVRPACWPSRLIIMLTSAQLGLAGAWAELGKNQAGAELRDVDLIIELRLLPSSASTSTPA